MFFHTFKLFQRPSNELHFGPGGLGGHVGHVGLGGVGLGVGVHVGLGGVGLPLDKDINKSVKSDDSV